MLAAKQTALTIVDLAPQIGSEIRSDIQTLLNGLHAEKIRALLEDRGVVVFRELKLTDQQQVEFTKTLGTVVEEGEHNIYKVSLDPMENVSAEYLKGAFFWHIDGTLQNVPVLASLLSCWRPSPVGGQTEFCNTYAAYDDLPESDKKTVDTLKVVHSQEAAQRYVNPEPSYAELLAWRKRVAPSTLPLVWKHRSGRKSLVLGSTAAYVVGLKAEDSADLLCRLRDHATQAQYKYRHDWKVGDLVIWDNTGTMHRALSYPLDSGRMMHRTKLQGEESFA
jgi:alpha-ketoglutarate-dependent taurine dioxygenase